MKARVVVLAALALVPLTLQASASHAHGPLHEGSALAACRWPAHDALASATLPGCWMRWEWRVEQRCGASGCVVAYDLAASMVGGAAAADPHGHVLDLRFGTAGVLEAHARCVLAAAADECRLAGELATDARGTFAQLRLSYDSIGIDRNPLAPGRGTLSYDARAGGHFCFAPC